MEISNNHGTHDIVYTGVNRIALLFYSHMTAILGQTDLKVEDLLNLKVGDILTLNTKANKDVAIYVEDQLKFYGRPGITGKNRGIQITANIVAKELEDE